MNEHLLTAEELAEVLGVNRDTVLRLARGGIIPSVRLTPRLIRFSGEEVQKALRDPRTRKEGGQAMSTAK
jgi:excisionase family DNA binding protein